MNRFCPRIDTRLLLTAALGLGLAACSSAPVRAPVPPPLVQHHPVEPAPPADLLGVTPRMRVFLERYVLPHDDERLRLSMLLLAVADTGVLGFHYNVEQTRTAAEAFEARSGNCVAFANLFVALAREAGLKARFQEVQLDPVWDSRQETLLVTKHVNVEVRTARDAYMVDVSGQEIASTAPRRVLSDEEATALFYNNLGAEALIAGDNAMAYAWFLRAIESAPGLPDAWSNLGVLYGRNGQSAAAEVAYLHAIRLGGREMSAMSNLHDIYVAQGRLVEAEQLQRRVERYRHENPFHLLQLGEEALMLARLDEAVTWFQRGLRLREDIHQLHYGLARARYLQGDLDRAQVALERALELAPHERRMDYRNTLKSLVLRAPPESVR